MNPAALEKDLVDRVVVCWLDVHLGDFEFHAEAFMGKAGKRPAITWTNAGIARTAGSTPPSGSWSKSGGWCHL